MIEESRSKTKFSELSHSVVGCAMEVHRQLGPGLLEKAYQRCLCHELSLQSISFQAEVPLPVAYKGVQLDCGYRIDLLVERKLIIEVKSVDRLQGLHQAQLLTYMKLTGIQEGVLLNFNVVRLKEGLRYCYL